MPSDGTIGGLVGKLLVLRIECPMCGRHGRYYVARLVAEFGAACRLTDWLHERTADCRLSTKESGRCHASLRRGHAGFGRFALSWLPAREPDRRAA
jgi:hypothetical protein